MFRFCPSLSRNFCISKRIPSFSLISSKRFCSVASAEANTNTPSAEAGITTNNNKTTEIEVPWYEPHFIALFKAKAMSSKGLCLILDNSPSADLIDHAAAYLKDNCRCSEFDTPAGAAAVIRAMTVSSSLATFENFIQSWQFMTEYSTNSDFMTAERVVSIMKIVESKATSKSSIEKLNDFIACALEKKEVSEGFANAEVVSVLTKLIPVAQQHGVLAEFAQTLKLIITNKNDTTDVVFAKNEDFKTVLKTEMTQKSEKLFKEYSEISDVLHAALERDYGNTISRLNKEVKKENGSEKQN